MTKNSVLTVGEFDETSEGQKRGERKAANVAEADKRPRVVPSIGAPSCASFRLATRIEEALALDPTRSLPAWRTGLPEEIAALSDNRVTFYREMVHLAQTSGM